MKVVKNANGTYTLLADSDEENTVINVIHELVGWSWKPMKAQFGRAVADAILDNCGCYLPQFDDDTQVVPGVVNENDEEIFFNYCSVPGEDFIPED